jgi:hypothetical protein
MQQHDSGLRTKFNKKNQSASLNVEWVETHSQRNDTQQPTFPQKKLRH